MGGTAGRGGEGRRPGRVGWMSGSPEAEPNTEEERTSVCRADDLDGGGWQLLGWAGESCPPWPPEASENPVHSGPGSGVECSSVNPEGSQKVTGQPHISSPGVKGRGSGRWGLRDVPLLPYPGSRDGDEMRCRGEGKSPFPLPLLWEFEALCIKFEEQSGFCMLFPLGTLAGGVCHILVTCGPWNSDGGVGVGGPGLFAQFRSATSGEQAWL